MRVLTLVDNLHHGGVQRMAVNIANALPSHGFESYLCTIQDKGDLKRILSDSVLYHSFNASSIYSINAARLLARYCQINQIDLLHVHHRSLFPAFFSSFFNQKAEILWHDHYGRQDIRNRPWIVYYLLTRKVKGIISVSHPLQDWAYRSMHFPKTQVRFIPNFVEFPEIVGLSTIDHFPGKPGYRIVAVANFRPHKDHLTLVHAFKKVLAQCPKAHLILVGKIEDQVYFQKINAEIARLGLNKNISNLGQRMDVYNVLKSSDIGVLSSNSEALPLTLIEYGIVGLPVACTRVGDCQWLIKDQQRGLLSEPADPEPLAKNILYLLRNAENASLLGENLQTFVKENLNKSRVINEIIAYYYDLKQIN